MPGDEVVSQGVAVDSPPLQSHEFIDPRLIDPSGTLDAPVIMPGVDGMPFRGRNIPDIKENDPAKKRPQEAVKAHVDILVLNDTKQVERYKHILQVVANGFGIMGSEDRQYDPEAKTWRVLVRWWEVYTHM